MKKIKIKAFANWGFVGCTRNDVLEFEVPANATDEEIEKEAGNVAWDWACERLDVGFEVINEPPAFAEHN